MGILGRTWQLYRQSFGVLSAAASVLVAAGFFVPLVRAGTLASLQGGSADATAYGVLFLWYYLNFFLVLFFNSALVACADIRLKGGDPPASDGLRTAVGRLGSRLNDWMNSLHCGP